MIKDEEAARAWIASLPEWDEVAEARIARLVILLTQENTRQNLVSSASLSEIWCRHIADSAQLLSHVPRETTGEWIDLGTGAGFPGLVIAIMRPDWRVTMVESRSLRADWLRRAVTELEIPNAQVIGSRLELVESRPAAMISARAFAPLGRLLNLSARFSRPETIWLLPKGRSAAQELRELKGWEHMFHVEQSLTDPEAGLVVGNLVGKARHHK